MSTDHLSFYVAGVPVPEGSTKAFLVAGKPRITHQGGDNLRAWRQRIAHEAQAVRPQDWRSDASAYEVKAVFIAPRPASVKPWHRVWPTVAPDCDKLLRALDDALTGILWPDDAQVIAVTVFKVYEGAAQAEGKSQGVNVSVWRHDNTAPRPERRRRT